MRWSCGPNQTVVLPEFLPFLMMSDKFMKRAVEISVGSLSPTINWTTLKLEEFDLPPLDQQRRIAEILWAVDEAMEQIRILEMNAIAFRNAQVRKAAEQESSQLRLGDIAMGITSGSRGWAEYYTNEGAVFVRITNLQRGNIEFDWSDIQCVSPPKTLETERTRVKSGDVLISITAELGLVALADSLIGESYINQHIAKVSLDQKQYDPYLAAVFLSLPPYGNQFRKFNDQGAKAGMNLKNVAKLTLPALSAAKQAAANIAIRSAHCAIDSIRVHARANVALKNCLLQSLLQSQ